MAGHPQNAHQTSRPTLGFTIVELLIVIVVIGILAAITIVAFNGVSSKARVAKVTSELNGVSKKLKIDQVSNSVYPATLAAADEGKGISTSAGTSYQYTVDNSVNPQTFCVTAVNGSTMYYITESGKPTEGLCPGHSSTGYTAPTIANYYDFTTVDLATSSVTLPSIPDNSWMIIVMAYTSVQDVTPPAGWTTLYTRLSAGTLQTMVFGKIKSSSEPATISLANAGATPSGVIFWGTGASGNLNSWIKGTRAVRDGSAGQQYITTTPTITTTTPQSLVLSISAERTSLTETDISSLMGATKWFFIPHAVGGKIQTITLGYATVATPSVSVPVVVTYPNPQTVNGMAFQIALPPS